MQLVTGTLLCSCSGVVTFPVVPAAYEQGALHESSPQYCRTAVHHASLSDTMSCRGVLPAIVNACLNICCFQLILGLPDFRVSTVTSAHEEGLKIIFLITSSSLLRAMAPQNCNWRCHSVSDMGLTFRVLKTNLFETRLMYEALICEIDLQHLA